MEYLRDAGGEVQWVDCLLSKREALASISGTAEIQMERGITIHACNPRTREVETGGLGISRLHRELDANLGYVRPCFCFKAYGVARMARSMVEGTDCHPRPDLHPQVEEENQLLTVGSLTSTCVLRRTGAPSIIK